MSRDVEGEQATMDQKMNELVQQSRVLEAYMNDIVAREATITRLIQEARLASGALHNMVDETDLESLTPVGIGVYMKAVIPPVKKLIVNIGAGVTIEKTRDDTINYVESKLNEFEVGLRQLNKQRQQISLNMEQIQLQVNQMLRQAANTQSTKRQHSANSGTYKQ
jgi:prefoldin alpha subunit